MDILLQALTQGIAPAIVVAIYLVIVKAIDTHKEKSQVKVSTELVQTISYIGDYIKTINEHVVEKDKKKCENAINDSINAAALNFIQFLQTTLLQNHIEDNKENIMSNIHNIANSEYYNIYSTLNNYEIGGIHVSEYLDKEWIKDVETDLVNIIFTSKLKNEAKLIDFTNRITLKFNSYITRITNKISK